MFKKGLYAMTILSLSVVGTSSLPVAPAVALLLPVVSGFIFGQQEGPQVRFDDVNVNGQNVADGFYKVVDPAVESAGIRFVPVDGHSDESSDPASKPLCEEKKFLVSCGPDRRPSMAFRKCCNPADGFTVNLSNVHVPH